MYKIALHKKTMYGFWSRPGVYDVQFILGYTFLIMYKHGLTASSRIHTFLPVFVALCAAQNQPNYLLFWSGLLSVTLTD